MPPLDARLLGGAEFAIDGRVVEIRSAKARAMLAYLAATRQVHSRERLAGFFWPDVLEANALASLRTALYDIRRGLGPVGSSWLSVERSRVSFQPDGPWNLDVALVEAVSPEHGEPDPPTLEAAVAAYGGDFLAGLTVADSYDFDDWVLVERERLAHLYLSALCQLGAVHSAVGKHDRAIDIARRALAVDPLREDVHRDLMVSLARAGRRAEALTQFDTLSKLLADELGIEPLATTVQLRRLIAADEMPNQQTAASIARPVARAAADRSAAPDRTPISERRVVVGREKELGALRAAWAEVRSGKSGLVMLYGESGIGKSFLLSALAHEVEGHTLVGRGHESADSRPFGPIVDALRHGASTSTLDPSALPEVWQRELARLVPEWLAAEQNPPLDGFRERDRLFEAVAALLAQAAARAPVLFIIDDAQWVDETSLGMAGYLVRQLADKPILVAVAARNEDVGTERRVQLRALAAQGREIHLGPLDVAATESLVALLGGPVEAPAFAAGLCATTGGNPYFVSETLNALFEQRTLTAEQGTWTTEPGLAVTDYTNLPVPSSVGFLVDRRLDRLPDDTRCLLDCAAALRRDFPFDLVQEASGLPPAVALDALDRALASGILREAGVVRGAGGPDAARYDFVHALVRDRVYGQLSAARRQFLHRQLAGRLEGGEHPEPDRIAYHYLRGGDRRRAFAWSLQAGAAALSVYAAESALQQYEAAAELAADQDESYAAFSGLGDALMYLGRGPAAAEAFDRASRAATSVEDRAETLRRLGRVHERAGDFDLALDAYSAARLALRGRAPSLTAVRIADGLATVYVRLGRAQEAVALCGDAMAWLDAHPDVPRAEECEAWLRNTYGMALLHAGDFAPAVEHLTRGLQLKQTLGDRLGQATLLNNLGVVHYRKGNDEEARDRYAASLQIKEEIGDGYGAAIALTNLALMETHLGQLEAADEHLARARASAEQVGASWLVPEIHRVAALRALGVGDVSTALQEAEGSLSAAEILAVPAFIGTAHRALGLIKAVDSVAGPPDEHFETSLAVFEMLGDEHELAKTHADYAAALVAQGRPSDAEPHVRIAAEVFRRTGADGRLSRVERILH